MKGWPLEELCKEEKPKPVEKPRSSTENHLAYWALEKPAYSHKKHKYPKPPSIDVDTTLTSLFELIDEGFRLMTSREGDLGWASPIAQPGNDIYLLAGCSMPVILRSHKSRRQAFIVIGHAYVDGMMDGEFCLGRLKRGRHDVDIL